MSGVLYALEWSTFASSPRLVVVLLYLHVAAFSSTLIAGLWSLVNECLDPHSAKRHFARISMGGTVGGAAAGLAGWQLGGRLGATALLPLLALTCFGCALAVTLLARRSRGSRKRARRARADPTKGTLVMARSPYLRHIAVLVLLSSLGAALLDYVLSSRAKGTLTGAEQLVTFFALFHMGVGVGSFLLQAAASRVALERAGIAGTVSLLPLSVLLGGGVGLLSSALWAVVVLRGLEALVASSLYRAAYELLYTPVPKAEKRQAKMLIDVGVNRIGAVLGSGAVMALLVVLPRGVEPALIVLAMLVAAACAVTAIRLHGGYVRALETSLKSGAVALSSARVIDPATRRTLAETAALDRQELLRAIEERRSVRPSEDPFGSARNSEPPEGGQEFSPQGEGAGFVVAPSGVGWELAGDEIDDVSRALADLRSEDEARVRFALARYQPLPAALVPAAIDLLARDDVCRAALASLREVAPKCPGQLVDALLDRDRDEVLRHRIPRTLEACTDERTVHGLLAALFEPELDVRYQAALALLRITEKSPELRLPRERIIAAAGREIELGQKAWSDRALAWNAERADERLRNRTDRGMEYAICVLSLILDREPLQIAYRALFSEDELLRGTAIEYLDNVLPEEIKEAGMAFIGIARPVGRPRRKLGDLERELLHSRA
ncbi:MAG: hypothetical protein KC776_08045 [Myxococcales bacterium]|nr:hypothetical protein [Myxococcales bacterium]MCB9576035.1 hypothetical protein [Polyangiaceae bacterium]